MSADRDLARAIYDAITAPDSVEAARAMWQEALAHRLDRDDRVAMWRVLARTSSAAIEAVLVRRLSEAARTGPWDGGHHFQEEDGYPGSLAARCHTVVIDEGEGEP